MHPCVIIYYINFSGLPFLYYL
uniref:Uncharacterized protein n=1 Tax=Lepeophtheirus salmonis TaxID=72036 RepID=A0A0K2V2R6_LEPSM